MIESSMRGVPYQLVASVAVRTTPETTEGVTSLGYPYGPREVASLPRNQCPPDPNIPRIPYPRRD